MKAKILLITAVALQSAMLFAQTSIPSGNVSGTWTLAGSPYNIQGSIQIPNDSTLTIQPGVTVEFQGGNYKLLVNGRLLAIGTANDTITFTATNTTNGWRGIRFDNTASTNDTSKLKYCKIQYGKATGTAPEDKGGAFYFNNFSKAIISNGRISNCTANSSGGGVYCSSSSPTINNSTISNNTTIYGGGISCDGSSSTITNNTISFNTATYCGGIYCQQNSNPVIANNTISNNTATLYGGGILCYISSPSITNNTIVNNTTNSGGGIYCQQNSNPVIANNTISNNTAISGGGIYCTGSNPAISYNTISDNLANGSGGGGGGGINCNGGSPTIINNNISNNTADIGGGIDCSSGSPIISNNTISNNTASSYGGGGISCVSGIALISGNTITNNSTSANGGGIYCESSSPTITNNTLANNSAANGGALYCTSNSDPTFRNSILWGNTAITSGAQAFLNDEASDPNLYYCDVQGGTAAFELNGNFYTGTYSNNINTDPFFVAPSGGSGTGFNGITADWSLQSSSPCIDTGDPSGTYPATDMAGNPRVVGGIIDIGAYEYQGPVSIATYFSQIKFAAYPNPTNDNFVIQMQDAKSITGNLEIEIYNILGEKVFQSTIKNPQSSIDFSSQIMGIYFITIKSGENVYHQKLIKE